MAGKPSTMQLIFVQLVAWLGWLSAIAFAQLEFSEAITGSANITNLGITCLANGAVFFTSLLRGRLYLEMGARDVMVTTGCTELEDFKGFGLNIGKTEYASVVMLSKDMSNSSIKQFMKYIYKTHDVYSILLKYLHIKEAPDQFKSDFESVNVECQHKNCNCIVFRTMDDIKKTLVRLMPGTLNQLRGSWCLLPCSQCLRDLSHGCNEGLLCLDERKNLTNGNPMVETPAVVCEVLDSEFMTDNQTEPICICIPLNPASDDDWTKLLMKSFKSKDEEDRGAIVMASIALENYLSENKKRENEELIYRTISLTVPRIIEISINLLLTVWIKLDGFSSAMVARKAVRNHVVNSTGNGFAAKAFLTGALVKCNASNTMICCQVLRFRGGIFLPTLKTISFIVGFVTLICSFTWAVVVAIDEGAGKRYEITSMTPSRPRIAVIIATIGIGSVMDCLELFTRKTKGKGRSLVKCAELFSKDNRWRTGLIIAVMILETSCIVSGGAVLGTLGIKEFGRWVYSALQVLVWIKWGIGCYVLGEYSPEHVLRRSSATTSSTGRETLAYSSARWSDEGTLVYSSAFLFNAVLAGVRGCK